MKETSYWSFFYLTRKLEHNRMGEYMKRKEEKYGKHN